MHAPAETSGLVTIHVMLNGEETTLRAAPWAILLDVLRLDLGLTGTKKGCDHGQCGACTVLIDGQRINSCLQLAALQDGASIVTIEGIASEDGLHPLQAAFVAHDALQCGYCTPGQICSGVALLSEGRARTREDVREMMSGNLCRCGAYPNIVDAIMDVMGDPQQSDHARVEPGQPAEFRHEQVFAPPGRAAWTTPSPS